MRRAIALLLLALAIVSPLLAQPASTPGPTTRYSRLYMFGDISDIGAGYIDGNGPTAVAYLGWLMGLRVASSKVAGELNDGRRETAQMPPISGRNSRSFASSGGTSRSPCL